MNKNIDATLDKLQTVKTEFGSALSWADLIVLAGTTALEHSIQPSAGIEIPFCEAGRVDDTHGNAWKFLKPRVRYAPYLNKIYRKPVLLHLKLLQWEVN